MYAFEHEGKVFLPDGKVEIDNVAEHNKQVEQEEIAWLKTGPDKCFLYVKMPAPIETSINGVKSKSQPLTGTKIQTFLGTSVATDVIIGMKANIGFGFHTYRRSVTCRIFGVLYHGWYMESSGDYCRLKKARRQV